MKSCLALIVLSFLLIPAAQADNVQVTKERNFQIANAIFKHKRVSGIAQIAMKNESIPSEEISKAQPYVPTIDCDKNPETFMQPDKSFCAVRAVVSFGWYADPVLLLRAVGFIKRDKIQSGALSEADLVITNVVSQTPLPTGLE